MMIFELCFCSNIKINNYLHTISFKHKLMTRYSTQFDSLICDLVNGRVFHFLACESEAV